MTSIGPDTVVPYLVERAILPAGSEARVAELPGGVSSTVLEVRAGSTDVVVKQALGRLRVDEEWLASTSRIAAEARALELAGAVLPGAVPAVLDVDVGAGVLTIERAPRAWRVWKSDLLDGRADPSVAERLGTVLATWHERTTDPFLHAGFEDRQVFFQLRVDPFHRVVAERLPEVREQVEAVVAAMLDTTRCIVHGDFTPKNILVGDGRSWVIDWEVVHLGDPSFDLGSMLCHLMLKAVHLPASAPQFANCAQALLGAYSEVSPIGALPGGEAHLVGQVGCLLLARVVGKSPAGYLTPDQRTDVLRSGIEVLARPITTVDQLWDLV